LQSRHEDTFPSFWALNILHEENRADVVILRLTDVRALWKLKRSPGSMSSQAGTRFVSLKMHFTTVFSGITGVVTNLEIATEKVLLLNTTILLSD
jgi:hypothetical protein